MKIIFLLSRAAVVAVVAAAGGIAFDALALALFAGAASTLVLLIAAGDYARRPQCGASIARPARTTESMPLAA